MSYLSRSNCLLWSTSRHINELMSWMSPSIFPKPKPCFLHTVPKLSQHLRDPHCLAICSHLSCKNFKLDPPQWNVSVELAIGESIHSILLVLSHCHGLLVTVFPMDENSITSIKTCLVEHLWFWLIFDYLKKLKDHTLSFPTARDLVK